MTSEFDSLGTLLEYLKQRVKGDSELEEIIYQLQFYVGALHDFGHGLGRKDIKIKPAKLQTDHFMSVFRPYEQQVIYKLARNIRFPIDKKQRIVVDCVSCKHRPYCPTLRRLKSWCLRNHVSARIVSCSYYKEEKG